MTMILTVAGLSARGLLSRRRMILLVLFAGLPVLVAILLRIGSNAIEAEGTARELFDALIIRTILPLVALVFGTAAIGSELEDGTAVYLLVKPIPRWQIVVAKLLVAGLLTAGLMTGATLLAGLVLLLGRGEEATIIPFAIAVGAGSFMYVGGFLALSLVTGRALVVGLGYTLIWEGVVTDILEGTKGFSVRQYMIGIVDALGGGIDAALDGPTSVVMAAIVLAAAFWIATVRLSRYEVHGGD
jgi:ABC-2 type transport system permease protein